jgi:hypothetical protein
MICTSRNTRETESKSFRAKKTHQCCREYQFIERAAHPLQPALEGVACHGLLVVTDLEGGSPRGAGEFQGSGFTVSDISR